MSDTNDELNYYYYFILYGLSFIVCLLFLFISVKNKLYRKIITEYIQYILIAEIIFCISKCLCFLRFNEEKNYSTPVPIIQLTLDVFSNILTISSTFFVALKIYDSVYNNSKLYRKYNALYWSRISIAVISIAFAVIIGCLHGLKYNKEEKCNIIICAMDDLIGNIVNGVYLVIMLIVFIICLLNFKSLNKGRNEVDPENEFLKQKLEILTQRVIFFPLGVCLVWFIFISVQYILEPFSLGSDVKNTNLTHFYFIFTGVRGLIYPLLCLLMNNDFKRHILDCGSHSNRSSVAAIDLYSN